MNSKNTNNAGFGLIELVVVIVLLVILVTVAVPKFISLKSDSKAAHLQTIAGAMEGGLSLINSNAIIHGENIGTGQIIINGTTVSFIMVTLQCVDEIALQILMLKLKLG